MIERYTRPAMGALWSEEKKLSTWLEVEIVICEQMEALGLCPAGTGARIRKRARFDASKIKDLELLVKHDVIAFVSNVAENLGDESRFFHYGLTSSDLLDTSEALLLRDACLIIESDLEELKSVLRELALRHKGTVMAGRTHGVHAEPITFGLKVLVWFEEAGRNLSRVKTARDNVSVGKVSGAVGTFSHLPPELEELVCKRLGLQPEPASTQIVQRDRHAELLCALAVTAASLEKFATEIRHLQRTEVREVEECFAEGQKGSSAMPHKRNPILCERICGLARVVRSNATAGMEDVALWHERDISHSSVERIIVPDSFILVDYMLATFTDVMRTLRVYPERMKENVGKSGEVVFSQRVLLELVKRGMRRDEAYGLVQSIAGLSWSGTASFRDAVLKNERLRALLDEKTLEECFDISYLLRNVDRIYQRVLGE
ncbi:MAG: adenylosuccinate lyase [Candidatus Eisenbacteria bacterium]|nr:adenylosuccinate lyase [Candidatus Eisenbacteria bacterium]